MVAADQSSRRASAKAARFRTQWSQPRARRREDSLRNVDLSFVANLEIHGRQVRMYRADTGELVNVCEELPWPVKFTMVRYHHKHAFEQRSPPCRRRFLASVKAVEDKLKWRAPLQDRVGDDEPALRCAKHRMYDVAPYDGTVTLALKGLLQDWRDTMLRTFSSIRRRCSRGNMIAALR